MQFVIDRDVLLDALARVVGIVPGKSDIPILRNCLITTGHEVAMFRTYSNDIEVVIAAPAEIAQQGALTCEAKLLHEIARKSGAGAQLSLTYAKTSGLTVRCGRARYQLGTLPVDDFPSMACPDASVATSFDLPSSALRALINNTRYAAANDETRYYLNGVYLHISGEHLMTVATDGKRLAKYAIDLPPGAVGCGGAIVSRGTCTELLRFLPVSDVEINLRVSASRLHVVVGNNELIARLVDGIYPDWRRVVPGGDIPRAIVPRERLLKAVTRVATVLDEGKHAIKIEFYNDNLQVRARAEGRGSEAEDLVEDVSFIGDVITVGVNARLLLDILNASEATQLAIFLSGVENGVAAGALRFEDIDGDLQRMAILMPVRLCVVTIPSNAIGGANTDA